MVSQEGCRRGMFFNSKGIEVCRTSALAYMRNTVLCKLLRLLFVMLVL